MPRWTAAVTLLAVAVAVTFSAMAQRVHRVAPAAADTTSPEYVVRQLQAVGGLVPRIVNGVRVAGEYPTVGMLGGTNGFFSCTGTLIGCHTFLTAAHCVSPPANPADYLVYLQHGGFFAVSSVTPSPDYEDGERSDVAVIELSAPVTAISPSLINTVAEPPEGTAGTIVGFGGVGTIGDSTDGAGIKRGGNVVTADCTVAPDDSHICWDFLFPIGPEGEDSNTCFGDSGGPLFTDIETLGVAVAGVTSGGSATCRPNANNNDADVHYDHEWIESVAGSDLSPEACGSAPPVLGANAATQVLFARDSMSSNLGGVLYSFAVPAGKSELRITTNGEIAPASNFDLYVKLGSQPTVNPPSWDCASKTAFSFEGCSIDAPAAGTWWVLVANPFSQAGDYDFTVSILGALTVDACSNLDFDADSSTDALTDGVLAARYLFGFTGPALTAGVLGPAATRGAPDIVAYLDGCGDALDLDDNGERTPLTDGVLLLRYLMGLRDDALIDGALGTGCDRCEADDIEDYIASLL